VPDSELGWRRLKGRGQLLAFSMNPACHFFLRGYGSRESGGTARRFANSEAEGLDNLSILLGLASVKQTNPNIYCYENELNTVVVSLAFRMDEPPFNNARL